MKRKLFAILMTLTLVFAYMPATAFAARWDGNVQTGSISVGETKEVVVDNEFDYASFEFRPTKSGTYCFSSSGDRDSYGRIMFGSKELLHNDDINEDDSNFKIVFHAEEGEVYVLDAAMYSGGTGSFEVTLSESDEEPYIPDEDDDWGIAFNDDDEGFIILENSSVVLKVEPWFDGASRPLTYQWFKGTRQANGEYDFSTVIPETSDSITVSSPGRYQCVAKDSSGNTDYDEVDVRSWYVDMKTFDADTTFHPGTKLDLQVLLSGKYTAANMKYDWYSVKYNGSDDPTFELLAENSSSTYTIPATHTFSGDGEDGEEVYKCIIKETKGSEVVSEGEAWFYVDKGNEWWVKDDNWIDLPDSGSVTLKAELSGKYNLAKMTFQWGVYEYDEETYENVFVEFSGKTAQTLTVNEEGEYVCKVKNTENNTEEDAYFSVSYPNYGLWYNNVYYHRLGHSVAEGAIATYNNGEYTSFAFPASVKLKDGRTYPLTRILAWQVYVDDGIYLGKNCKTVTVPASVKTIDNHALGYYMEEGSYDIIWKKVPGFTIIGTTGSEAQRYANANGFAFRDPAAEALKRDGVADKSLPKVKMKKPAAKKTAITLKWTKLNKKQLKKSKAAKYEIWVSTSKSYPQGATKELLVSKSKASAKIKGLKKNTKYFVKIRSIKYVGGVKHVGKWTQKTVKTPKK